MSNLNVRTPRYGQIEDVGRYSNKYIKYNAQGEPVARSVKGYLNVGFNYEVKYCTRKEWGAVPPRPSSGYLCKPASHVRLTTTRSNYCADRVGCAGTLQKLQSYHMNNGLCDIPYNFLIGGDYTVYEGRGFLWNPLLKEEYGELDGKVLDIAMIGTFQEISPSPYMMTLALDLINAFVKKKDLIPTFQLISFPETRQTPLDIT
ncbi:peptidoglycan-recognition protein SD-like [Macrosteles quadrilineatus]|uniref:peptidoglycan-recognition protein SD-like n=1 Tax=Macrosteles quadrilineatus TaxID=74068 RepID=UPI0023E115F6|nr:peptidoglycan-recognition protein SD-like [Macrosteles quadrilineatus]